MKTKFIFLIFTLLTVHSQAQVIRILDELHFHQVMLADKTINTNSYEHIKGSPYLDADFKESTVYFKNDSAYKIALRYNIFDQRMEYNFKNQVYSINNPLDIQKIEIGNRIFIYYYSRNNYEFNGYYQLFTQGKASLLLKREIVYREEEKSDGIVEAKPERFLKNPDKYYIVISSREPELLKNKKSLKIIFSDNAKEMEAFAKKEKISFKKTADLIRLVDYYNSLQTN